MGKFKYLLYFYNNMGKKEKFNWKEFFRIALAVFLIGVGIGVVGKSGGNLSLLVIGFALVGIGIALFVNK